jgi:hypothetical protein
VSVPYHAWTHTADGTDPIPVASDLKWATATAPAASVTASSGKFLPTLTAAYSNDATGYELASGWLQINNPGYYVFRVVILTQSNMDASARDFFVQPVFLSGGTTPADLQDNTGVADFIGDWRTPNAQLSTGDKLYAALGTNLTFNYDPDNPVSDIDFESPLQVSVMLSTFSALGGSLTMGSAVHAMRVSGPGYVSV